jgi:putative membrane protein
MRKFDGSFRNDLRKKVEAIEQAAGVELVVTILPRASRYLEYYFGLSTLLAFVDLTVLMFIPIEIWYVLIYLETVALGLVGVAVLWIFPGALRFIVGKDRLKKRVEMRARAIFQQAQIYETRERVGILVVFSWLEQRVMVMPDKGVAAMVPPDEWAALEARCKGVFTTQDPPQAVLDVLDQAMEMLARYVPPEVHPINELPDELWIE